MTGAPFYLALLHHPVRDRHGAQNVTTAVTTLDVHDLARVGKTYDARAVFVVTPIDAQRRLVDEIRVHFTQGAGAVAAPDRAAALRILEVAPRLEDVIERVSVREGGARRAPRLVLTTATAREPVLSAASVRAGLARGEPAIVCFGTGHGIGSVEALIKDGDGWLPPLEPGSYNHLSVRGAMAILVDRLVGAPWPE